MIPGKTLSASLTAEPIYIEDVFSTYLYTGNGTSQTITNGIDLSGEGGLVWIKQRSLAYTHALVDTVRGTDKVLCSNNTNAEQTGDPGFVTQFNSNGFAIGDQGRVNLSTYDFASWTFRQAEKFFDVVTYTGNGSLPNQLISHNLGSVPGCIIIKATSAARDWIVWHRGNGTTNYAGLSLNLTSASAGSVSSGDLPTSTQFKPAAFFDPNYNNANETGVTYVAYLFAHDAGGFGDSGSDNVISCGSFTTDGSGNATVSLGYEPQWVMYKKTNAAGSWTMIDVMRGMTFTTSEYLFANLSDAAFSGTTRITPVPNGFDIVNGIEASSSTYIYIAIRRGPMKTPTTGTSVFYPLTIAQADSIDSTNVPFPPDLVNTFSRNGTDRTTVYNLFQFVDRLRSLGIPNNTWSSGTEGRALISSSTDQEYGQGVISNSYVQLKADSQNITRSTGWNTSSFGNWINYFFRRAPKFFDVVCYTGTGAVQTISHNLGIAPSIMIIKRRSSTAAWTIYPDSNTRYLNFDTSSAPTNSGVWNDTSPTASVFTVGTAGLTNAIGQTYVAYLFGNCPGVSSAGTYTGTGTTQQINCGFASGARFVLIKCRNNTGPWYVWDSARGIVAGNDPYLLLNSSAAEVTNTDYIDTYSQGFEISSTAPANINGSGSVFIYIAIA